MELINLIIDTSRAILWMCGAVIALVYTIAVLRAD